MNFVCWLIHCFVSDRSYHLGSITLMLLEIICRHSVFFCACDRHILLIFLVFLLLVLWKFFFSNNNNMSLNFNFCGKTCWFIFVDAVLLWLVFFDVITFSLGFCKLGALSWWKLLIFLLCVFHVRQFVILQPLCYPQHFFGGFCYFKVEVLYFCDIIAYYLSLIKQFNYNDRRLLHKICNFIL